MNTQKRLIVATVSVLAILANTFGVIAQEKATTERRIVISGSSGVVIGQDPAGPMMFPGGAQGDTFVFISSEMGFGGKLVKGAPYSAQAVTESVQMLSDGNRITHKSSGAVYRDSEGRTRNEQSLGPIGPWAPDGAGPHQTIFINDPVAGVNYMLNPADHTARKVQHGGGGLFDERVGPPRTPPVGDSRIELRDVRKKQGPADDAKTESLGKRTIEGVDAEGTRITHTVPAGEIGNDLPIQMVIERWYSPELQVLVMSKHSDPRFGETTYRLTNISRSEPSPSLFTPPSDYTIKEGPEVMMRRPAPPRREM